MASYSQPCARHLGPGFRQGPLWLDLRSLLTYSARRRLRTLLKKYVSYICLIHLRRPNALAETEGRCEQEAYDIVFDIVFGIVFDIVFGVIFDVVFYIFIISRIIMSSPVRIKTGHRINGKNSIIAVWHI